MPTPRRRQRRADQAASSAPAAPRDPLHRRAAAGAAVLIAVAATVERWWLSAAWGETGTITSAFYFGDATRFVEFARAIVDGRPYDNGIPFHPPGWPMAMAAVMEVTGGGAPAIKILLALVSGATVGLAAWLAFEMAGTGAMLAAGVLGTFHFGHLVQGTVANSEALYGLLTVVAMSAVWRWRHSEGRHAVAWAGAAGAAGGAATLVRAEFLACAALFLIGWWIWRAVPRPDGRWPQAVAFIAAFAMVLTPSTVSHWQSLSRFNAAQAGRVAGPLPRFAPVTSYGPFNFAMANHEHADGGPNRDHPRLDECDRGALAELNTGGLDLACPAVYDLYVNGYAIGAAWLAGYPGAAAELWMHKVGMAVGFLAHGYFIDNIGAGVDGVRRRVDMVDPLARGLIPVHGLLAVAGALILRRRAGALGVFAAPLGAFAIATLLFYGYVRLGVAYLPAVWILQGAGIAAIAHRLIGTQGAGRRAAGAVLVALALGVAIDGLRARGHRALVLDGARTTTGALVDDETLGIRRAPDR